MRDRHNGAWLGATVVLLLAVFAFTRSAEAQELDTYHQFMLDMLADEYNITGGELILDPSEDQKLDSPGGYGHTLRERRAGDPGDLHPFDYVHVEAAQGVDPWSAGISWPTRVDVMNGEVGLAMMLIRGETTGGSGGEVNIIFERGSDPYDKSFSRDNVALTGEWQLILHPFVFHDSFTAGTAQLGMHLGLHEQYVDVTAPVVINFGDKYTQGVLEGLIATHGQVPLLASFSQSTMRGVPPFTVNFDASASSAPGTITNYSWNFGDGATGTGMTTSHEYTAEGAYDVILTITDNTGATHKDTSVVVGFGGLGLPDSPLEIPYTAEAPAIDGEVDAAWSSAATVDISWHVADQPPVDESDVSGTASTLWDAQYLYVLYRVTDDVYNNDSESSYQDDAVDLYIDGLNEKAATYDANDAQYEFSWGDETYTITGNGVDAGLAAGVEYRYVDTATGYNVEARIPWSNLETLAIPNTEIGIDFMINDGDLLGNVRDTKLSWYALQDVAHQNASILATARLVGGEGQITTAHFTVSAEAFVTEKPITFDASQSVAPGSISSYAWDFGDGESGEGMTVEHAYTSVGSFTITLTITDDQGTTATTTRTISVVDGLGTPEKPLEIPRAVSAPVIDGQMEPMWTTDAVSVQMLNQLYDPTTSEVDLAPTAYAMWDDTHIYIYYDIVDDTLVTMESADTEAYKDDDAEFFIDPDNSKTQSAHDGVDDGQFSIRLNDAVMTGDAVGLYPNSQFVTVETENGWALELSVPWGDVNFTPAIGKEIGIDFQVNDDDDGGERDHKASWYATEDNGWQWAHVFGTAVLSEEMILDAEDEAGLPNRFAIESVYPNPFNPSTTAIVSVRNAGAYDVRVYNVLGQLIQKRSLEVVQTGRVELDFDLSAHASGMYLISVEHKATGKTVTSRAMLLK